MVARDSLVKKIAMVLLVFGLPGCSPSSNYAEFVAAAHERYERDYFAGRVVVQSHRRAEKRRVRRKVVTPRHRQVEPPLDTGTIVKNAENLGSIPPESEAAVHRDKPVPAICQRC